MEIPILCKQDLNVHAQKLLDVVPCDKCWDILQDFILDRGRFKPGHARPNLEGNPWCFILIAVLGFGISSIGGKPFGETGLVLFLCMSFTILRTSKHANVENLKGTSAPK